MRIAFILLIACLCLCGCSRPDGRPFDGLLSSNRIDRIEIVDDDAEHTKILTAGEAERLLSRLAATNRVSDPLRSKSYSSGHINLLVRGQRVGYLAYFPSEQVLSYGNYEFSFRDTNDLATLFR